MLKRFFFFSCLLEKHHFPFDYRVRSLFICGRHNIIRVGRFYCQRGYGKKKCDRRRDIIVQISIQCNGQSTTIETSTITSKSRGGRGGGGGVKYKKYKKKQHTHTHVRAHLSLSPSIDIF